MANITFNNTQELTHAQLASILRKALNIPMEMGLKVESVEQGIRIHTSQEVQLPSRRGLEEKFGACVSSLVANSNGLGHKFDQHVH